jgi:hypothetical protein
MLGGGAVRSSSADKSLQRVDVGTDKTGMRSVDWAIENRYDDAGVPSRLLPKLLDAVNVRDERH